jgi:hypothetical protein
VVLYHYLVSYPYYLLSASLIQHPSFVFGASGHPHAPAPMTSPNLAVRGAVKRATRRAAKAVWKTAAAQARVAAAATVHLDPTRGSSAELQVSE